MFVETTILRPAMPSRSWSLIENALLLLRRQTSIKCNHLDITNLAPHVTYFPSHFRACVLDLLLASKEYENITRRLTLVNLYSCSNCGLEIISLRVLGIEYFNGVKSSRYTQQRGVKEVSLELFGFESR